jgi:hypothetical protein
MLCCKKNTHKALLEEGRTKVFKRNNEITNFLLKRVGSFPSTDERKNYFVDCSIVELRSQIIQGKVSSEELTSIFLERCYTIGKALGGLADICHNRALEIARSRDDYLKTIPMKDRDAKLGPLFGVPLSIKDNLK